MGEILCFYEPIIKINKVEIIIDKVDFLMDLKHTLEIYNINIDADYLKINIINLVPKVALDGDDVDVVVKRAFLYICNNDIHEVLYLILLEKID